MEPTALPRFGTDEVRRYYERHTRGFLAFGQGGRHGAIRRAVWGPGVTTRAQAFAFVDDLIAREIARLPPAGGPLHVVDFGCGVGATLCYLATRLPVRATGLTLSPLQAGLAARRIAAADLAARVACRVGDFCTPPADLPPADAACAIEAFAHGPDAARFFEAAARVVRPGGLLAVCDDFLGDTRSPAAARAVGRVRRGWRLNTIVTPADAIEAAARAGFVHAGTTTLTPWLELDRPRDRLLALVARPLAVLPFAWRRLGHLLGGAALRRALARGWVEYDLLLFRRRAAAGGVSAPAGPMIEW